MVRSRSARRLFVRVLIVSVLSVLAAAMVVPTLAAEPIKIGFFAPLTGPAAADGKSVRQAAELAVDQLNDAGGINGRPLKLIVYDDRFDPKEAVYIASKLIEQDRVVAVVSGSYSGPTRAVAPIYQRAKIPMISSYGVHPDITKAGRYIFRQSFIGTVQGRAGAEAAVGLLGAKKVSILMMDNDFGRELGNAFKARLEKLGAKAVSTDLFPFGEKDFTPILTKVKALNPDLIYNTGYIMEGSLIIKQARELGIKAAILGTEGIDSFQLPEVAGSAAEDVVITTNLNRDDPRPVVQNFIKQYRQRYGMEPDMVGASTYDAIRIVAHAIKLAGTDPTAIRDAIAATKNFDGVTGIIKGYTSGGEVLKPVQVQVMKNGRFHYFGVIDDLEVVTPPQ